MKLSTKILLGMLLGIVLGAAMNGLSGQSTQVALVSGWLVDNVFDVVGQIFVASLKLLVVPLVFVSLVCGSSAMGVNARMGHMAAKTLGLYLLTTALAVTLALLLANTINPGEGLTLTSTSTYEAPVAPSPKQVLIDIFPTNPVQAMAQGNMLQIIVFAILMGLAITHSGAPGGKILDFFQSFNEVIMTMVSFLMHMAPYGVFCLLAKLFSELGIGAIADLAKYFLAVVLVLFLHGAVVYGFLFATLARLNPLTLFKNIRPALLFAFSTSSSSATLPVTLNVARRRIGIDNSIASFTLPLGATINMDGTAIMQGVATVFIAQAFNVDISLGGYVAVVLTATLASIGTAGVPGVGLITLSMVLQQVGLPVEGIALIIGVDRLLDMLRTAVNVGGDCMVSTVVAKSENLLDAAIFNEVSDKDEYTG